MTSTRSQRYDSHHQHSNSDAYIPFEQSSVTEHVYMCLLKLYQKYQDQGLRGRILQCLGRLNYTDGLLRS